MNATIFALASGGGRAALSVYRLSGPEAGQALRALTKLGLPQPRLATLRTVRDQAGQPIDQGLVLWFPAPASFTGEDVVELHLHGGRAVSQGIARALLDLGLQPAEPGDFTRRAFEAGKLDLTQAEAIADLVDADTAAQRRQALAQLEGSLSQLYEAWRLELLRAQAHLEAAIDFAEEDLPPDLISTSKAALANLAERIKTHLADDGRGERVRDGLRAVLLGAPNAGKSSLLNVLAGRDAAIVSATAGTTRDVIEVALDLAGYPILLADTAGLRVGAEEIEREGVRRARERADAADIKLLVLDGEQWPQLDAESMLQLDGRCLLLLNKADLVGGEIPDKILNHPVIAVSAKTGQGVDRLLDRLASSAEERMAGGGAPALTRARHRSALIDAEAALRRAQQQTLPELVAEDVRVAARAIGRITGRVDVEAMLDIIFREFCIGK
jgi:tRNA modification GTPase